VERAASLCPLQVTRKELMKAEENMISEDMELETQIGEARKKHEEILAKAL
jgi:hypothetical protein